MAGLFSSSSCKIPSGNSTIQIGPRDLFQSNMWELPINGIITGSNTFSTCPSSCCQNPEFSNVRGEIVRHSNHERVFDVYQPRHALCSLLSGATDAICAETCSYLDTNQRLDSALALKSKASDRSRKCHQASIGALGGLGRRQWRVPKFGACEPAPLPAGSFAGKGFLAVLPVIASSIPWEILHVLH